ncbi:MAG: hypothetical protein KAT05_03740, partial [Spirochaetes bacterium]|nr:hypothetical protein [Spirochaetota bacterium]
MNREDWFEILIETFRKAYNDLSEGETKHISNLNNLTEPCQILSITFDNPPLTKTFILHLPNVEDGKVWQYGPIMPYKAFELFEKIIANPVWDIPIEDERIIFYQTDEYTIKTLLDASLMGILREIRGRIFNPPVLDSSEPGSKIYFLKKSAIWTFEGDITKTDPVIIATQIIQDAKNAYKFEQDQPKAEPSLVEAKPQEFQKPSEPVYNWHGAHLFPAVSIGEAPRIAFSQRLFGGIDIFPMDTPIYVDKFNGRNFIATYNGFVGIQAKKVIALEMLNFLAAALFLRGTESYIIRDHELGNFQYDIDSKQLGNSSMPVTSRFSIIDHQNQHPAFGKKAKISIDELHKALKDAELYLKNEQLSFYIPLLLESNTHFVEFEYTQSFYMSWVVIETYLTRKWKAILEDKNIPKKRFDKLTNPSMWSIDYII